MTTRVRAVINVAQQLSPVEQLELIQSLSHSLQEQWPRTSGASSDGDAIPDEVTRTHPIADLSELAADFWPDDESADDITAFIREQRLMDRTKD